MSRGRQRSEQEQVRLDKLEVLRARGFRYPNDGIITGSTQNVLDEPLAEPAAARRFTIAGRVVQIRKMGKASFAHLLDGKGKVQIYVKADEIGAEQYAAFTECDLGDIVEARGYAFVTKTGEKSLHCEGVRLLVKAIQPPPEKFHGLTDVEARYRHRYVDLFSNPEVRDVFRARARIIREVRRFLDDRGYLEVETPTLQYTASGAEARPFLTHYNSLSTDMVCRIALELPLKKLIVGGLDRVYEIGKVFRNEGFSKKHNPEFTMLEFYQAYATYEDLMKLTEELFVQLVQSLHGALKIPFGDREIDFTPPWPRLSMRDSLHVVAGVPREVDTGSLAGLLRIAEKEKVAIAPERRDDWGRVLEDLWGELVEPKLVNPTFMTHHPFSISPLSRRSDTDPLVVDRFELIVAGMECANAFSELNDPIDQRERFEAQAALKAKGNEEMHDVDEDFILALEYGMPPTAGQGIGIDRLTMLLTNSPTIRDVLLFPQLKREEPHAVQTDEAGA